MCEHYFTIITKELFLEFLAKFISKFDVGIDMLNVTFKTGPTGQYYSLWQNDKVLISQPWSGEKTLAKLKLNWKYKR